MSDGHPTAPRKEALSPICTRGPLDTDRLGRHLPRARPTGGNPGHALALTRLARALARRSAAQDVTTGTGGAWSMTAAGRRVISCAGEST